MKKISYNFVSSEVEKGVEEKKKKPVTIDSSHRKYEYESSPLGCVTVIFSNVLSP